MEGAFRLLYLPNGPCATSKFEAIYGTFKPQYYSVDEAGNRKKIPISVELEGDGLGIFHKVTGNTEATPSYHFESFLVCSRKAYEQLKSVELSEACL